MGSYAHLVEENRRLEILRILRQDADYTATAGILQQALRMVGLSASADQVRTDIAWLAEQRLVEDSLPDVCLAKLTPRGADVAQGIACVPGVARPGPEAA